MRDRAQRWADALAPAQHGEAAREPNTLQAAIDRLLSERALAGDAPADKR